MEQEISSTPDGEPKRNRHGGDLLLVEAGCDLIRGSISFVGLWLYCHFVEQSLGVLQIGGIEAFGEPIVDFGEHCARFVAPAYVAEQSCQTHQRSQLQ